MYCSNCGTKLESDATYCPVCGVTAPSHVPCASEGAGANVASASNFATQAAGSATASSNYTSWEYARTSVKSDLAQVATDCYESLGFELTGAKAEGTHATTTLSFRRSRKVRSKAQLVKLQRTMDDLLAGIASMEAEKTRKASLQALSVGIVSALVLGVGMCCTMVWSGLMIPGIIIGVVGIIGCIAAFLLYRSTCAKEATRLAPRIEAAYDSLATACEEAQALLRAQAQA